MASSIKQPNENIEKDGTKHTIDPIEKEQFVAHINSALSGDKDIGHLLPINKESNDIFIKCGDGRILCKLINDSVPDTIDIRSLNMENNMTQYKMIENNNLMINSAKAIGCKVINIGSMDMIEQKKHLMFGLIWQIIREGLFAKITLKTHPELYRLLNHNEELESFLKMTPDLILLRWVNYHLERANSRRRISNFASDLEDSEVYIILGHQLIGEKCSLSLLNIKDSREKASTFIKSMEKINCSKFITADSIINRKYKLNQAFIAYLFNMHSGLAKLEQSEMDRIDKSLFDATGGREARSSALWISSLGIEPRINNLFLDLRDGIILLNLVDVLWPNCVDWSKICKNPKLSIHCILNLNHAIDICKKNNVHVVSIAGSDIYDGNQKLTLGIIWQLMRINLIQLILKINPRKIVDDDDILNWANNKLSSINYPHTIKSFNDPSLKSGVILLNLLDSIKPGIVNKSLISNNDTKEGSMSNSMYAISIARKLGATLFLLPEDIYEMNSRMILTFIASLMSLYK